MKKLRMTLAASMLLFLTAIVFAIMPGRLG